MSFNFEQLDVYNKAIDFADRLYSLTASFPREEMFGLTSQLRRAAVSIALNIAEGSARSKKEFNRFIDIARGSVFECVAILQLCRKQRYVGKTEFDCLEEALTDLSKMLSGLKKSLIRPTTNNKQ